MNNQVIKDKLAIPAFGTFRDRFYKFYLEVKNDPEQIYQSGELANYIPPLANVDPNLFATAFCSVDG